MILYDVVANAHLYNDIANTIHQSISNTNNALTYSSTTSDGTLFCIPETTYTKLLALSTCNSATRECFTPYSLFDIKTITFPTLIPVITMLKTLTETEEVYGVLAYPLQGPPVNLLHTLTPRYLLTEPYKKLVIYTYKTKPALIQDYIDAELFLLAHLDAAIKVSYSYKERKNSAIDISLYSKPINFYGQPTFAYIDSKTTTILPSTESTEHGIIPHFFLTKGIYYPYYGTSLYNVPLGSRVGRDLTAMVSANISSSGSICIGKLPHFDYNSYRCLNHSNLDSPYRTEVMPYYYSSIAEANKQFMNTIIKGLLNGNN